MVLGLTAGSFVNLSLSASKEIALSEQFALPVDVPYILNPDQERSFLVIGFRLSL